ncbi:MAG: tetratricopeptide repeat protein [Ktedonobacteraceae bacterium]
MEKVKATDRQFELVVFFQQVMDKAISTRLAFAQRECSNYQTLEEELPNLWEVVQTSRQRKEWKDVLSFQDALRPFLDQRGYWPRSLILNGWAIEAAQALSDEISVVRCTHEQADILHQQGYYHEAERLYQRCEVDYRRLGQCAMAIKSRHMRSLAVRGQGRLIEAKQLCESTIREARELSQDQWLAHPFYVLALLARDRGNFQEAVQWIRESLERLTDTGEVAMLAQCHHFLGGVAFLHGNLIEARTELETSLRMGQQIGSLRRVAITQRLLGDLARDEGNYELAAQMYNEALQITSRLGDQPETGRLFIARGVLMIKLKQPDNAIMLLSGAVATYKEIGHAKGVANASLLLFRLYLSQGQGWQVLKVAVLGLKMARAAGVLRPAILLSLLRRGVQRNLLG